MSAYKHVVFDIDNTLTNLSPVLNAMGELYEKDPVPVDDVFSFRLAEAYDLTPEQERWFWDTQEPKLIRTAELSVERATALLDTFTDEHTKIALVSNRDASLEEHTRLWAEREGFPYDAVYCIGKQDKAKWIAEHLPETEAVFEDNPDFFEQAADYPFDTYCIDYPYNQDVSDATRLCRENGSVLS